MLRTYSLLVVVMMTWGFNVITIKILVSKVNPILMTSMRLFVASLAIMLIIRVMKRKKIHEKIPWKYVILSCLFAVVLHHLSLSVGIQKTTAVKTGIILGLGPLIAALVSIIFQISPITKIKLCGFVLGTVGVGLAVLNNGGSLSSFQTGDVWIFVAILSQITGIFIINKISNEVDPLYLTSLIMFIGSIILFFISLIFEKEAIHQVRTITVNIIGLFIYSSLIPTAFGQSIYNLTINKVGPAETAIFINVNTIFALLGAVIFMKETVMPLQIVGCVLIIIGVIIGTSGVDSARIKLWYYDIQYKKEQKCIDHQKIIENSKKIKKLD